MRLIKLILAAITVAFFVGCTSQAPRQVIYTTEQAPQRVGRDMGHVMVMEKGEWKEYPIGSQGDIEAFWKFRAGYYIVPPSFVEKHR